MGDPAQLEANSAITLLQSGELQVEGRLVAASNTSLLCRVTADGKRARCIYKPVAGERPLWDFPDGTLAGREVAAYLVSAATGWQIVPPTLIRDGPFGPGMCQLWVDHTGEELVDVVSPEALPPGWLRVVDAVDGSGSPVVLTHLDDARLRRVAVFDVVINNADRKAGHLLIAADGTIRGVDHGVSFHVDDKLRTVLWGWGREPLSVDELRVLQRLDVRLAADLGVALEPLLTAAEVAATRERVAGLLRERRLPAVQYRLRPIPWPVF